MENFIPIHFSYPYQIIFVVMHSLNETYISLFYFFQILFFSVSFFSFILLSLSFSPTLSVFAYPLGTFSFSFCLFLCLSSTFFLAVFHLSPLILFVYHLLSLSASVSFLVFYFPSFLGFLLCFTFFLWLASFLSSSASR